MLCLALQPGQKSGLILVVVLKLKLPKNHFIRKFAPKLSFFIEKKIRKFQMIFVIHFESPMLAIFDKATKLKVS